jgi:hypothetical protein
MEPFLLSPAEWEMGQAVIIGGETLYKTLKGWGPQLRGRKLFFNDNHREGETC